MSERRMSNNRISRRTALHGLGVCMVLPPLEAMVSSSPAAKAKATLAPKRMAFVYAPNGKNMEQWRPKGVGSDYTLSPTLEPLAALKGDFQVLSGLDHRNATNGGDGPGDHARLVLELLRARRAGEEQACEEA